MLLLCYPFLVQHYDDVLMTTMATQITSLTVVYSTVYSDAHQRKHQSSASLAFVWGIHRDRWIPRTKGQLRGKCFHLMTSSWIHAIKLPTLSRVVSLACWELYDCHSATRAMCSPKPQEGCHDDVVKWKHFPRYWPFVRGIHRSPVNSTHKGQWRGALMFSLICAQIKVE